MAQCELIRPSAYTETHEESRWTVSFWASIHSWLQMFFYPL
jgi:hypothetical protein